MVLSDILGQDRSLLYSKGGCFIATSRIIINDLLKGVILPTQIQGMLVYNAHKITESSIETFILRVFKQGNPAGFVKVCIGDRDANRSH
jgi:DNA excision repair protein ERCC-4